MNSTTDKAWREVQYNIRARITQFDLHFAKWREMSAQALECAAFYELDIAYGVSAAERLDVFAHASNTSAFTRHTASTLLTKKAALSSQPRQTKPTMQTKLKPVLVFIHGGYWRALDKADHAFVATPFLQEGAVVVIPNYALCPAVTIAEITLQMTRALLWVRHHIEAYGGDVEQISLVGHSAGGHLAAMMLACEWHKVDASLPPQFIKNALSISGLFDLRPLVDLDFLKADLHLTKSQAEQLSPALWQAPACKNARGELFAIVGGDESQAFQQQTELIQKQWGRRNVPICEVIPKCNHFDVLEALTHPSHRVHEVALQLLKRSHT